jgi:hypothetical protein
MSPSAEVLAETAQPQPSISEEAWKIVRDLLMVSEWLTQEHNAHE